MFGRRKRENQSSGTGRVSQEQLLEVLEELCPGLNPAGINDDGVSKSPTEVAAEMVTIVLERPEVTSSPEWSDLFVLVEVLLDKGADPPWDGFAQSFLEDLLNAVSHGDLSVTRAQIDDRLNPASRRTAAYLDRVWVSKLGDEGPEVMDAARFSSIESPELRWIIRRAFRRTPDGTYVGIGDILKREAATGRPGGL